MKESKSKLCSHTLQQHLSLHFYDNTIETILFYCLVFLSNMLLWGKTYKGSDRELLGVFDSWR